ncbi:MAG: geranylgeranyl reductase family protein [Thermoplasmata archaeon]
MKTFEYDVLVIGAGPGGSTAARFAARKGLKVLLVEKRPDIGSPVRCGEGISKTWLPEVEIEPQKSWISNEVEGARIYPPDEKTFIKLSAAKAGNEVGYIIERDKFDKYLAALAAREGAEIWVKSPAISLIKDSRGKVIGAKIRKMGEIVDVKAKIIIGADGFESQVGRWAKINTMVKDRDIVSCVEYRMVGIDLNRNFTDFYLGSCAPGGYVWVFPKDSDEANVGIGVALNKLKSPGEVKKYLDDFIEKHPGLKKGKTIELITGAVSTCQIPQSIVTDNVMLVGDSARLIDPITGGGISNACITGKLSAEAAYESIKSSDSSKEFLKEHYEKKVREKFERKNLRNWFAKEKLSMLSDETLNKLVDAISEVELTSISVKSLLDAVQKKYPELVKEFEDLL